MLTTRYDKTEAEPFSFLLVFRCVQFNIILIIGTTHTFFRVPRGWADKLNRTRPLISPTTRNKGNGLIL